MLIRQLVAFLDGLIDEVGEDETHPLASLMELVGVLIERYEDENVVAVFNSSCSPLTAHPMPPSAPRLGCRQPSTASW